MLTHKRKKTIREKRQRWNAAVFSCLWLSAISISCELESYKPGIGGEKPEDISLSAKRHLELCERSAVVVKESV